MKSVTLVVLMVVGAISRAFGQHSHEHAGQNPDSSRMVGEADAAMSGPMSTNAMKHLELSTARTATHADSARAMEIVTQLRSALAKYTDTAAAVADGYRMFAPQIKQQRVYHFTNYKNAFMAGFRFDPAKPTSILYQRARDGTLKLVGAMYTAPKRADVNELNARVPLSIARWHKHVKWCVPKLGHANRWLERRDSMPVFGPESPIDTRAECRKVGGMFFASPMGWMIHANVFAGDDLATIFAHEH